MGSSGTSAGLQRLLARARCLLWEAEVEQAPGGLRWMLRFPDPVRAAALFPLKLEEGDSYEEAWLHSRLEADRHHTAALAARHITEGAGYSQEYRCRRADGEVRWLHEQVDVEPLGPGCWHAVGVCMDITEQKRADEFGDQLCSILEKTSDFVGAAGPQGEALYLNPAARRTLGIAPEADLSEVTIAQAHPDWAYGLIQEQGIPTALELGTWRGESALRSADGREIPVSQVIVAHRSGGRLEFFSTIARDISERMRIEAALREAESRFRAMTEASPVGIFLTDTRGEALYVNPEGLRQAGLGRGSVSSASWMAAVHPEDRAEIAAGWQAAVQEHRRFEGSHRFLHMDGTVVWVHVSAVPVNEAGSAVGYLGVSTDITRDRDLEEQLRQAQKMEAVGRLAGGVAHDFNNMLAVISGYSEILLRGLEQDHPMHGPLQEIRKAGERAASLTRQLLAYSRRQMLEPREFDLNEVLVNLEKMLRRLISEDIELACSPCAHPVRVTADPGRIEQVVVNLVVNARDAMPGGGRLSLRLQTLDLAPESLPPGGELRAGPHACLEVRDTGTGIPPDILTHVFEPFFTTKPVGQGTGLGLSTAYGTVKQSGGHMEVESRPGEGTVFRVYLPCQPDSAPEPEPEIAPLPAGGTGTVLLVEDEEMVRGLTRTVLEMSGYAVIEAQDGAEAVRLCREQPEAVDLILSDVVMPHMSGRELAVQIQTCCPGTPVLFMSGHTDDRITPEGLAELGVPIIQKPFSPNALADKVRELLSEA